MNSNDHPPELELTGTSAVMRQVLAAVALAARSEAPVLLRGEIGTEKLALARRLHDQSGRRNSPFVPVAGPLLDELLGHELAGAPKSTRHAVQPGRDLLQTAAGGTLFFDDVAELSDALQLALQRLLEEGAQVAARRGGGGLRGNPRIIGATRRDLEEDVTQGRFREGLFFRLNVLEILVPPLRERSEDILPLVRELLGAATAHLGRRPPTLSEGAERVLVAYPWPGNVLELRNAVERALLLWPGDVLDSDAFLPQVALPGRTPTPVRRTR